MEKTIIRTINKSVKYSFYKNYFSTNALEGLDIKTEKKEYHADTKTIDLEISFVESKDSNDKIIDTFYLEYSNAKMQETKRSQFLNMSDDNIILQSEAINMLIAKGITSKKILSGAYTVTAGNYIVDATNEKRKETAKKYLEKGKITQEQHDYFIKLISESFIISEFNSSTAVNDYLNSQLNNK